MFAQLYIVNGDSASLLQADGRLKTLHFVDQNQVSRVITGNVTHDGVVDAVYQYEWGGYGLVDYNIDGSFEVNYFDPVFAIPRLAGPFEINIDRTADVMGGDAEEIIYRLDFNNEAHSTSIFYAYDYSTGQSKTLMTAASAEMVQGFGDLDANGKDDILFTDERGTLNVRLDNGEDYQISGITTNRDVIVAGVGEFKEGFPGLDEILFYNSESRTFDVWVKGPVARNGGIVSVDYFETVFTMPEGWSFNRIGDFDGDGIDDIMIAQTGDVWIQMVGLKTPMAYWSVGEERLVSIGSHDMRTIKGAGDFIGLTQEAKAQALFLGLPDDGLAGGTFLEGQVPVDLTGIDPSVW
ncbi:MAG TPA: hypothetical protein VED40_13920 [Azospirillaceae bacterium]|nr:hypothetical protein [Azospirillaceae bacterium]